MWVFCKNGGVKQKKQVLSVKQTESYARADVIALSIGNLVRENNGQTPFYASICSASMGSQQ